MVSLLHIKFIGFKKKKYYQYLRITYKLWAYKNITYIDLRVLKIDCIRDPKNPSYGTSYILLKGQNNVK